MAYSNYTYEPGDHDASIGHLTIQNNRNIYIHHNNSNVTGGGLDIFNSLIISGNNDVRFEKNTAGYVGGAIYSQKNVVIDGNNDVYFVNNEADRQAGAIYVQNELFIGNNNNVVFAGNVLSDGTRNAIYQAFGVDSYISANAGKSVTFYDGNEFHGPAYLNTTTENSIEDFYTYQTTNPTGTIEFSGGDAYIPGVGTIKGVGEKAITNFANDLTLGGGTMTISEGAKVNVAQNMHVANGSTLHFNLNNTKPDQSCALTVGSMSFDDDKQVTINSTGNLKRGKTYNLIHYENSQGISLSDYTLLKPDNTEYHWDPGSGILSLSVDNYITKAERSMKGSSLWNSTYDIRSLLGTIDQRYIDNRYMCLNPEYKTVVWAKYIGNYQKISSGFDTEGSSYDAYGFALGGDTRIASNALLGISYSETWGKNKFDGGGRVDSDNYMIALYSDICLGQKGPGKLGLSLYAGYGMNRYKADLPDTHTKWDGQQYVAAFRFNYHYTVSEKTVITPYAGMLWQFGQADASTSDSDIRFGKEDMSVLQFNVGVLTQHKFNDKWGVSGEVGVNPDLYRRNPKGTAILNGVAFDSNCTNPGRVSMNVEVGVFYNITPKWMLTASYGLDVASHANQQTMQVGASYSF